jgi:acetyltransferase-like isoleucine patch superfamily enzyme
VRQHLSPELEIERGASANVACARFALAPGSRLVIRAGAVTDRIPGALYICVGTGAEVVIGAGSWLRTEIDPVRIVAFDGARIELGANVFLNGCHVSAKSLVRIDRGASVGLGSRVFDADQHDFDESRPEQIASVTIGAYSWVASGVTVLRGVSIGAHSVIGAHSLVSRDIPPHTLAFGQPARPRGAVGDRSKAR